MRTSKLLPLLVGTALTLTAAPAAAAPTFTPCPNEVGVQCTTVPVPLDRSGTVPGTVNLHVARVPASRGAAQGTLVLIPGGPGQSSLPLVSDFRDVFHTVLERYDLVIFDSRGTGSSGVLDCPDLQNGTARDGAACAAKLGAARAFYTTRDSVADLEAVRAALGIPKIALYGVSYGTKVARAYALSHPTAVERLILDSAVPAAGPDVLMRSTFAALPRVLADVCVAQACRGVTANPSADLARLLGRLGGGPLHGFVFDGHGRRHRATLTRSLVLEALLASDVSPGLRATLPAAIRSAAKGDPAPVLRILSGGAGGTESLTDLSEGLFAATTCEEAGFPWSRTSSTPQRQAALGAAVAALPAGTYAPFDAATALGESVIPLCLAWPEAPTDPTIPLGPVSGIPTLIFSGQEDLRTPLEDAQRLQAGIADSQLVQVADTGHSVLGTALDNCPGTQFTAFFRAAATRSCLSHSGAIGVAPLAPHSLGAAGTVGGVHGARGHVVAAVADTLDDASDAFIAAVLTNSVIRFGGLRGGWGRADGSSLALHNFTFVPHVKISGRLRLASRGLKGTLRVKAPNGLSGTLRTLPHGVLAGTLGGRHVRDHPHGARAARAGAAAPLSRIERAVAVARRHLPPRLPLR